MARPDWLDELSLAVADGTDPGPARPGGDDASAREAACLRELAALRGLFRGRAAGAEAAEPLCPFRWGRLEVIEPVGQGSFSRVYRAQDPILDRDVALKLFRRDAHDLDAEELIAEARRHARVHHPRVLTIHGAAVENGAAGLWMDLLQGSTLAEHLEREGPMGGAALRRLAWDVSAGLRAVHDRGIVHGDLKPANVWIDLAGRAILMDFGAARPSDEDAPVRFGSPATMAPELFEGEPGSEASDGYALGALLYVAATGRYPVTGGSLAEIRDAHRRRARVDRVSLRRAAGGPMAELVMALLAREPAARPTLAMVAARLAWIEERPQRRFRRLAIGAVMGSLAAGLLASLWLLERSREAEAATARQLARTEEVSSYLRSVIEAPKGTNLGRNVSLLEAIEALEPRLATALLDDPIGRADVLVNFGASLVNLGELDDGGRWLAEARALLEENGAAGTPNHHFALRMLAVKAQREGRIEEAIALLTSEDGAFRLSDSPGTDELLDAFLLSRAYEQSGRIERALALAEEANRAAEAHPWPEPDRRLLGFEALALVQLAAGQFDAAEATLTHALRWAEAQEIPTSSTLLDMRGQLVSILIRQGRLEDAEPLAVELVDLASEQLGETDVSTLFYRSTLGTLYYDAGRYEEAVQELEAAYGQLIEARPDDHQVRAGVGVNLANAYSGLGRKLDALDMYQSARADMVAMTGPESPNVLMVSSNIAEVHVDLEQWEQAYEVAQATVALDEKVLGDAHPYTNHARIMLGAALARLGRAEEGAALLNQAAAQLASALGPESPLHLQAVVKLVEVLVLQERVYEARALVKEKLPAALGTLGPDHPYTRRLRELDAEAA